MRERYLGPGRPPMDHPFCLLFPLSKSISTINQVRDCRAARTQCARSSRARSRTPAESASSNGVLTRPQSIYPGSRSMAGRACGRARLAKLAAGSPEQPAGRPARTQSSAFCRLRVKRRLITIFWPPARSPARRCCSARPSLAGSHRKHTSTNKSRATSDHAND